jgi:ubiquinone/menaquinone biosynthesis C-methylase UbiE
VLSDRGNNPAAAELLDVGAGTGRFLTFVRQNHKQLNLTALDLNLFCLAQARDTLKTREGEGRVTFVEANAETLPVETESMDVVTCNFVLSAMPADAQVSASCCAVVCAAVLNVLVLASVTVVVMESVVFSVSSSRFSVKYI